MDFIYAGLIILLNPKKRGITVRVKPTYGKEKLEMNRYWWDG
jgi:hypothetical protein